MLSEKIKWNVSVNRYIKSKCGRFEIKHHPEEESEYKYRLYDRKTKTTYPGRDQQFWCKHMAQNVLENESKEKWKRKEKLFDQFNSKMARFGL